MATVKATLSSPRLTTHPGKTFIGRTAKGFDFLGYHFLGGALYAARKTIAKMTETAARLYEQKGREVTLVPLGQYLTRWNAWFRGGLDGIELRGWFLPATQGGDTAQGRQKKQAARW